MPLYAPATLQGSINLAAGAVAGTNLSQVARQANLAALQEAVHAAVASGKFMELPPGRYQVEGPAGLTFPASDAAICLRGSKGSWIEQFSNDAPIMTIGDLSGARDVQNADFRGFRLSYNEDQSGRRNASALRIGRMRNSTLEQVLILAPYSEHGPTRKAYRGFHTTSSFSPFGFFSNTISDVFIGGADHCLMDIELLGTGSVFSNVYLTQGVTGHPAAINGPALRIKGGADLYESLLQQINIEWCATNELIVLQSLRGTVIQGLHLEGNVLTGTRPRLLSIATSQVILNGVNIFDTCIRRDRVAGPRPPALISTFGETGITGQSFGISWSRPGQVDIPVLVLDRNESDPKQDDVVARLTGLSFRDVSGGNADFLMLDRNLPTSDFPMPKAIETFSSREGLSQAEGVSLSLTSDATIYGQYGRVYVRYPAALGGTRCVTLSDRMKRHGPLSGLPVPIGALVSVRRNAGQADRHPLVIRNLTPDGAILRMVHTADAIAWFRFDGSNWHPVD